MWNRKTKEKGTKLHEGAQEDLNECEEVLQDVFEKQVKHRSTKRY